MAKDILLNILAFYGLACLLWQLITRLVDLIRLYRMSEEIAGRQRKLNDDTP